MNNERIWNINSFIQLKGQVHINDLLELYPNVSSMTIRRDIDSLEKQGYIVRTRGGAKSISHLTRTKEDIYQKRAFENVDSKLQIAKKAAVMSLEPGAVYFDSGTTVMNIVKALDVKNIFAITSGPNISMELCRNGCLNTVLLGGNVNRDNLSVSGTSAIEQIRNINIGVAFIGASGFSSNTGFTIGNQDEGELKKQVIERASCVVLVMDSSKFDRNLPYTFARLSDIDYFITDSSLPADIAEEAKKHNVVIL